MTAIFCGGNARKRGLRTFTSCSLEQLGGEHLLIADVQVLLAPVPDLPARDLPFGSARIKRRNTRAARQLSPHREHVCVTAWQTQLSYVDRQAEGNIESKLILQESPSRSTSSTV